MILLLILAIFAAMLVFGGAGMIKAVFMACLAFIVYFTIRVVIFAGACYGLYWFLTR